MEHASERPYEPCPNACYLAGRCQCQTRPYPLSALWPYAGRHNECPNRERHRGPEGPNEDISACAGCGHVSYDTRPPGETWGWHADDCSLPVDHESYCKPGGSGHDPAPTIRGYWPRDPRSEDFRPTQNDPYRAPELCPRCLFRTTECAGHGDPAS